MHGIGVSRYWLVDLEMMMKKENFLVSIYFYAFRRTPQREENGD